MENYEEIINKVQWNNSEIKNIEEIFDKLKINPKRLRKAPGNDFIEFEGKFYEGILRNKLFDWFDIAKIVDYFKTTQSEELEK